jgi:hypothetical protein
MLAKDTAAPHVLSHGEMSEEANSEENKTEAPGSAQLFGRQEGAKAVTAKGPLYTWIQKNKSAALVGSFAVGVFLGVLLRRS